MPGQDAYASAEIKTWDAGGDGCHWDDPLNWLPNGVPAVADEIIVNNLGPCGGPVITSPVTIGNTLTSSGGTLTLNQDTPLAQPILTVTMTATVTFHGALFLYDGGRIVTYGIFNDLGVISVGSGSTITINSGGTMNINSGGTMTIDSGGSVANFGTINKFCNGTINQNGILTDNPPNDICPDTIIDSAVDRRGTIIVNSGTTASPTSTFYFQGTGSPVITGFECKLDGAAFSPCSSPITYTKLKVGAHTFQVRAMDSYFQTDPTPAQFGWTIKKGK